MRREGTAEAPWKPTQVRNAEVHNDDINSLLGIKEEVPKVPEEAQEKLRDYEWNTALTDPAAVYAPYRMASERTPAAT